MQVPKYCSRNRKDCAKTNDITETERAPIRDHRDTANEKLHSELFFLIANAARSNPVTLVAWHLPWRLRQGTSTHHNPRYP
jgi:hypothetical protein